MGFFQALIQAANSYYNKPQEIPAAEKQPFQETTHINKNDLNGDQITQETMESLFFQPVKGLGHWDRLSSANKYKSFAYAAINKRGFAVAKSDWYIYREFKSKKTEIKDHPLLNVFKADNVYGQNGKQLFYLTAVSLDLFPDVYWHVIKTETIFGTVVNEIRFLIPKLVEQILNKDQSLIEFYRYAGELTIPAKDVIHFKRPNPNNNLRGYAPADAFNFTLDIEYLQGKTSKSMFNNNANLEGIVLLPTEVDPDQKRVLKAQFKEEYTGSNQGGTLFIDNGADYKRVQGTPREMELNQARLQIRDEILVILDVPKTVMNISDDVNYSNSAAALRSFIENNIQPFAEIVIESKINSYFRKIYGDRFLFKMEWDFKTDRELQLKTIDLYLKHNLIKKEVIAEQEGYTAEDVPEDKTPEIIIDPIKTDN